MDEHRSSAPYAEAIELDSEALIDRLEGQLSKAPPKGKRFRVTVEEIDDEYEAWFRRKVERGLRAASLGKLVPHSDVKAWVRSWGTKNEKRAPTARPRRIKLSGRTKR